MTDDFPTRPLDFVTRPLDGPAQGRTVVQMRRVGSDDTVPPGWVVDPVRWNGDNDAWEVWFDPEQVSVVRTCPKTKSHDRRLLGQAGYRVVAADSEGACLWVADAEDLANSHPSRMDHTKHQHRPNTPQPAAGLW